MNPLIVANWKCNPASLAEAKNLFNSVKKFGQKFGHAMSIGHRMSKVEVVICPPFVYLELLGANGAQDCFWEKGGAFTGEISPLMLKNLGVEYVIIGHSERRKLGETNQIISKKIKAVLRAGLKPILCVANLNQLNKSLKGIRSLKLEIRNLVIAYEPLFAIGTGKPCTIEKAKKTRKLINHGRVLYGGSVNSQNARDYIKKAGFQGLLVGGASLDANEFVKIVKSLLK